MCRERIRAPEITHRLMHILHVTPTYLPAVRYGGPIFAVHGLCRALVSRGHKVEVFTTNIDGASESEVPIGVPVALDGVRVRYFSSDFLRRLSWAPSLARALKQELATFDLVHLHSVFLWPTWVAARLARRARVPYLLSPRGMLVKDMIERRNRIIKTGWLNLIEKTNLEGAAAIHVTSELEWTELLRFKWQLPRVALIPNGVDEVGSEAADVVSTDVEELTSERPLVLFLGRISWKKGLDRLLNSFALTSRGTLAIVGTDDERLVPQLRRYADKLQIGDRVRFLPRTVLGSDKEHLFAAAQLFVLPSFSENFGNTVFEAMQRGIPVVVTPEVGAAEIVRKAQGGIVADGDPAPLSAAINCLIEDPARARERGEAGRCYVMKYYTWPHVASKMEALYESVTFPSRVLNDNVL
jgi:glycosyltransferase involved in cell wall biosynthesis